MSALGRGIGLALVVGLMLVGCGPQKAVLDHALSDSILWPGEPERPRIMYKWSLRQVEGRSGGLVDILAGPVDHGGSDPRNSETLMGPHGVYVDGRGRMYVTDPGALRVSVVDLKTLETFQIKGVGDIPFGSPIGVVAGEDGRIYVSDSDLRVVVMYSSDGKFSGLFRGQMERPTGLAIDSGKGRIYVADTWGHTLYIYDLDGNRVGQFGVRGERQGEFNYPTHVAVDRDGYIYVSDTLNFRVQVFTSTGRPYTSFGLHGDTYMNMEKVKGIAVDSEGHIYVTDSAQDLVKIFDREGRLLLFFGGPGYFYGKFSLPAGIYIDKDDRIYVSDSINRRVQTFQFLGGD